VLARIPHQGLGGLRGGQHGAGGGAQLLGDLQRAFHLRVQGGRLALLLGRFHMHGVPRQVELGGKAGAAAHHFFGGVARAHAGQQGLTVGPHGLTRGGTGAAVGAHFVVHPVGGAAQGQLAQGQQVAFAKKVGGGRSACWGR